MSTVENFLTAKEEEKIILAIKQAEQNTSGEIRVHIESTSATPHYQRTLEVFKTLKMFNTAKRNAVLIYVAVDDHKFVVYGDKGIHCLVENNFWDSTKNKIQHHFKQQNFSQGIIDGVLQIGTVLKKYFPWDKNDINELPNEISKG